MTSASSENQMRRRVLGSMISMLLASGCTERPAPAETGAPIRETTPGGFTLVSYSSVPDGPVYEFEVVAEIGRRDDVVFGFVADIGLTDTNDILILDGQSSEIRRFDAAGREGERVAGPGQGPGELGRVNGFSIDRLGSVWVVDWGNMRTHEFPVDGAVRTHPYPVDLFAGLWEGAVAEDGRFWFRESGSDRQPGPSQGGIAQGTEFVYLTSTVPESETVDSIFLGTSPFVTFSLSRGRYSQRLPFTPQRLVSVDPSGSVWTALSNEYRLVRIDLGGDTLLVIEVEAAAAPLSRRERSAEIEALEKLIGPDEDFTVDWDVVMPTSKAVVQQITIDEQGNAWVQRSNGDGTAFDVFTRDGDFLARFEGPFTPWRYANPVVRGDRMVTVLSDSLDVHTVLVLGIPR